MHALKKFISTLRILFCLGAARTFGTYQYSTGIDGIPDCAVYLWRGRIWWVPIEPLDDSTELGFNDWRTRCRL